MADDYIKRQTAIKTALTFLVEYLGGAFHEDLKAILKKRFEEVPSADVVNKTDLLGWLLAYHTKSFELKGRYPSHEVISWLVNDLSMYLFEDGEQDGSID